MIITIDIQHEILTNKTLYTIQRTPDEQKYTLDDHGDIQMIDSDFDRRCRAADNKIFNAVVKAIEDSYKGNDKKDKDRW